MNTLWLDTETYSERPIKDGTYVYAANCEVDIIAWAMNDNPVEVIDAANGGDLFPFQYALKHTDIIVAHNAMFDRNALRLGNLKIDTPIEKWRCSMVRAMAHGLPGSLDKLGEITNIEMDYRKMKRGKELMMLFCKPRPKNSKIRRATKHTNPGEWAEYLSYATQDVVAMRAICAKLPSWNYTFDLPGQGRPRDLELAHWHRDQRINDRGFAVDGPLVDAALRAVAQEQARLKLETRKATDFDAEAGVGLGSTSQRDEMLRYLLEHHGVLLPDMKSSTLERRLEDPDLDEGVKELLRIRLQVSSTSTSKYKSLGGAVSGDGRCKGTIQFDGAARTRRACLAEGTMVLVRDATGVYETPIEQVSTSHEVWDGAGWVRHEGIVFSGLKNVISHDGIRATIDHIVWLDEDTKCPLQEAASKNAPLWRGRSTLSTEYSPLLGEPTSG